MAIQTSTGFVCVDKVEPRPMCGSGTTPQIRNGRLECDLDLECSPEQVAVETETGKVCWTLTSSQAVPIETPVTSEPPCPYGLVPLQTSVGRLVKIVKVFGKLKECKQLIWLQPSVFIQRGCVKSTRMKRIKISFKK